MGVTMSKMGHDILEALEMRRKSMGEILYEALPAAAAAPWETLSEESKKELECAFQRALDWWCYRNPSGEVRAFDLDRKTAMLSFHSESDLCEFLRRMELEPREVVHPV